MARTDYDNNTRWATRDPDHVRWEFEHGSDNWRDALRKIYRAFPHRIAERELDDLIGASFHSVFGAWKRHVCQTAWHTRPFYVQEIQGRPGNYEVWMSQVQHDALTNHIAHPMDRT